MVAPRYIVLCFGGSLRNLAVFGIAGLTCGYIRGEATITSHLFWSREGLLTSPSTTLYESNYFKAIYWNDGNILSIYFPAGQYFFFGQESDHNISNILVYWFFVYMYTELYRENIFLSSPKHIVHGLLTLHCSCFKCWINSIFSKNVHESESEDLNSLLSHLNAKWSLN